MAHKVGQIFLMGSIVEHIKKEKIIWTKTPAAKQVQTKVHWTLHLN
jgi:hypothetical protein